MRFCSHQRKKRKQCLSQCLAKTTLRQLHCIVPAMLAMTGRVTIQMNILHYASRSGGRKISGQIKVVTYQVDLFD